MIGFALDALISFSMVPLRIATYVGALLTTILTFVGIFVGDELDPLRHRTGMDQSDATGRDDLLGPASWCSGLIGEYVGRIYIQSKNRPLFMISHIHRRGRLPHGAADGDDDWKRPPFRTLLAQSEPKARSHAYDEAS